MSWNKNNSKWRAQISHNGKMKHLGYFADVMEAAQTYAGAARSKGF